MTLGNEGCVAIMQKDCTAAAVGYFEDPLTMFGEFGGKIVQYGSSDEDISASCEFYYGSTPSVIDMAFAYRLINVELFQRHCMRAP
jgi:hypothetical protein